MSVDRHARAMLPIPDRPAPGLTTYDAKDPETAFPPIEPLLPPGEAPLAERVEALGAWAQGFLYGFGAAGPFPRGTLPGDVAEVLSDFAEVSRAGAVGSESAEVEETALAELIEFLRVGAQLIYDELADLRATQTTSNARH